MVVRLAAIAATAFALLIYPADTLAFAYAPDISLSPRSIGAALRTVAATPGRRSGASLIARSSVAAKTTTTRSPTVTTMGDQEGANVRRVGVIGGGAAGLAAARAFLHANDRPDDGSAKNNVRFEVTVLEARASIGGIWKYEDDEAETRPLAKSRPMYRNLRTNLPKELMAFGEFPWGGDGKEASYVTHGQVLQYLEEYANHFDLLKNIHFGCRVNHLKVLLVDEEERGKEEVGGESDLESWPRISLEWTDSENNKRHRRTFDDVCVCNGHYDLPSSPPLLGLKNFSGRIMHAIEYDDPNDFAGRTVLCVGARASGADIAREIGSVARRVYLSDSSCEEMREFGNVALVPRTQSVDEDGCVHFSRGENSEEWAANDVDVIIFCSGYDYSFPFIDRESNLDLDCIPGERRVRPVYEQLWHAYCPSLSFVGLPHSVVPFPLYEVQSAAVVSQLTSMVGSVPLPPLPERLAAAERDAESGGPDPQGRMQDTHYLGSHQWDYLRGLARMAGVYDTVMENRIATNKAIYDRSGKERKGMAPGGEDLYRETRFRRIDEERSYEILHSKIKPKEKV